MITAKSLEKLREAAQKATPGSWEALSCTVCLPERNWQQEIVGAFYDVDGKGGCGEANAEFVAAANPQVILELVDENARLHRELDAANNERHKLSVEKADLEKQLDWVLCQRRCTTKMQYMGTFSVCPATSPKTLEDKSGIKPCGVFGTPYYNQAECVALWRELARKAVEAANEKLLDDFEGYGISIENIFLFDYLLAKPISDCHALNDVLEFMDENEIRQIFGGNLARRILESDPDLAAYFQEAGGVFIDAECDYPDWKKVDFYPESDRPRGWLTGHGRRVLRIYAPTLEAALKDLVAEAKKVEEAELEKAINAHKIKEETNEKV